MKRVTGRKKFSLGYPSIFLSRFIKASPLFFSLFYQIESHFESYSVLFILVQSLIKLLKTSCRKTTVNKIFFLLLSDTLMYVRV